MPAQLSTKLSLDGTQHNDALRNATKELSKYKREVQNTNRELKNMNGADKGMRDILNIGTQLKSGNVTGAISSAKSALTALGASAAKLAPAFAVAGAAIGVYTNHLKHDKVAAMDAEAAKRALTISVDNFSEALARADFSNFLNGLRQQIKLANEAAEATEAAARAALIFSNQYKKASIGYEQAMYEARDPKKTEAERKKALERAREFHRQMSEIENETSARDANAAYKQLQSIIGKGSVGSNMVAWGLGNTSFYLGSDATRQEIDYILKNGKKYQQTVEQMRKAWEHTSAATDGEGKQSFEWVREWQKLANNRKNIIAYKLFVDSDESTKQAIDMLNGTYDSDAWQKSREYMMGRTEFKVDKQAENEAKKRAAAAARALKEVKFDPLANTKEGWEKNVRALVLKYNQAKTDAERNSIADEIKLWQDKIDALDFNDNTIKGLQAQLKSVNDELQITDVKSEAFDKLKNKAKELQDKIDEINIADIASPETTREIQQKIQYLQHQLSKLKPNTAEFKKVTKEIEQWNELLQEKPEFGSNDYWENEINKLQERLNKEPLTVVARMQIMDEISTRRKHLDNLNDNSYIKRTQTSLHDDKLSQSYNNAQSNINNILDKLDTRMDYTRKQAIEDIAAVNAELIKLGLKPIKVDIQSNIAKDFENITNKAQTFYGAISSIDGVVGSINNLSDSLEDGANAWEVFMNAVSVAMNVISAVSTVVQLFDMIHNASNITSATSAALQAKETAARTANAIAMGTEASALSALTGIQYTNAISSMALAQATAKLAAAQIFSAHAYIPFAGVPTAAGFIATMEGIIAAVGAYAEGGIVGGNSLHGDKLFARVNSGEMILNSRQQKNLFNAIDNNHLGNNSLVVGEVRVKGSDLYLALKNYGKEQNGIGKNIGLR